VYFSPLFKGREYLGKSVYHNNFSGYFEDNKAGNPMDQDYCCNTEEIPVVFNMVSVNRIP
jgi:hypothetical protein